MPRRSAPYRELRVVVRLLAYRAETQALIPDLLHEAHAHQNFGPLVAQSRSIIEDLSSVLAIGMHNAVTNMVSAFTKSYKEARAT